MVHVQKSRSELKVIEMCLCLYLKHLSRAYFIHLCIQYFSKFFLKTVGIYNFPLTIECSARVDFIDK